MQVSIFTSPGVTAAVDNNRSFCYLVEPNYLPKICPIFFNKAIYWATHFINNYIQHFSSTFLFLKGDKLPYLSVPQYGEFFIFLLPVFLAGLFALITQKIKYKWFIIMGLVITPIPAALVDDPQIVRASALLPFIVIVIALGINLLYQWVNKLRYSKLIISIITLTAILISVQYYIQYFIIYPKEYDLAAHPLPKNLSPYLKSVEDNYDEIYFSKLDPDPHMYLAFYQQIDPNWYRDNIKLPQEDSLGFSHATRLGKYTFGNQEIYDFICHPQEKKILFVSNPDNQVPTNEVFYNYSQVHAQVKVYDIEETIDYLKSKQFFENTCNID